MLIQCHTKANGVAKPYPWGVNSVPTQWVPTQCNLRSILFQSKPKRPPITRATLAPIHWQSYTNILPIHYQLSVNPSPITILFQSIINPISIQSHSCTNPLPIICQSSDIAVQNNCQSITNLVLLIHCNPISIQFQYGAIRASKWHHQ